MFSGARGNWLEGYNIKISCLGKEATPNSQLKIRLIRSCRLFLFASKPNVCFHQPSVCHPGASAVAKEVEETGTGPSRGGVLKSLAGMKWVGLGWSGLEWMLFCWAQLTFPLLGLARAA